MNGRCFDRVGVRWRERDDSLEYVRCDCQRLMLLPRYLLFSDLVLVLYSFREILFTVLRGVLLRCRRGVEDRDRCNRERCFTVYVPGWYTSTFVFFSFRSMYRFLFARWRDGERQSLSGYTSDLFLLIFFDTSDLY